MMETALIQVALSPDEFKALAGIEKQGAISDSVMRDEPYAYFLRKGLIRHDYDRRFPSRQVELSIPRNALVLSDSGREALNAYRLKRQEQLTATRRYWVTTGIAVAALILSIVSLLAQAGLLRVPLITRHT